MSLVQPDFSEIQDEVTPGTYKVRIVKAEQREWSPGKPYLNWELETWGETDAKNNGRRIFHKTSLTGKGVFMLQRMYRAATGEVLTGAFDTEQLYGKNLEVEIVDGVNRQTGEATGYTEVKSVRPCSQ